MADELSSERVVAYPRYYQRIGTQFAGVKGEIRGGSARLFARGKEIPEQFSYADDKRFRIAGHGKGLFLRPGGLAGYWAGIHLWRAMKRKACFGHSFTVSSFELAAMPNPCCAFSRICISADTPAFRQAS